MLSKTAFFVPKNLIEQAFNELPSDEFRYSINEPSGDFFYDSWKIKKEYKSTVWEQLLNHLPTDIGEARIILLESGRCYQSHADIDDRYHLNLSGTNCYLINLENKEMFLLEQDSYWYEMNAGFRHSAANFGRTVRAQLVVRKLLQKNKLIDSVSVTIGSTETSLDKARYLFDESISPWLNKANKNGIINNFQPATKYVKFEIERSFINDLQKILPDTFNIKT